MSPIWTPAPSSAAAMRSGSSARVRESPFVCVEQTASVLGRPEEVGGLLPARVLVGRHENRSAVARDDLDGMVTGGDAVDERRQRPACFVGADGHRHSTGFTRHWNIVSVPSPRMVARWRELPEPPAGEPNYFTIRAPPTFTSSEVSWRGSSAGGHSRTSGKPLKRRQRRFSQTVSTSSTKT